MLIIIGICGLTHVQQDTTRKYAIVRFGAHRESPYSSQRVYAFYEDGREEKLHEILPLRKPFRKGYTRLSKGKYELNYPHNVLLILAYMRQKGYEVITCARKKTYSFQQIKQF